MHNTLTVILKINLGVHALHKSIETQLDQVEDLIALVNIIGSGTIMDNFKTPSGITVIRYHVFF